MKSRGQAFQRGGGKQPFAACSWFGPFDSKPRKTLIVESEYLGRNYVKEHRSARKTGFHAYFKKKIITVRANQRLETPSQTTKQRR